MVFRSAFLVGFLLPFALDSAVKASDEPAAQVGRPNVLFVLTDDHRWDALSSAGNRKIRTPHLDQIANSGTRFTNAFVTLAICSPSRAAVLTGRYGSANGVTSVGKESLAPNETTFADALTQAGYLTGVAGKWHLKTPPAACGFDFASTCWSNGTWYDREFTIDGETKNMPGFVDDVAADESIRFLRRAKQEAKPFALWLCTQVPHMDHRHQWPAERDYINKYQVAEMPLAKTWNDDLAGKPEYLKNARNRTQAAKYGYGDPNNIRKHTRDYYASVEQMDAAVGRVLTELTNLDLADNTWIIFMGDNGWMLGEHGMTSKVLAYEESMRVPMAIAGPGCTPRVSHAIALNIDLTATIYQLAGLPIPARLHGRSLLPILAGKTPGDWRKSFLYEAPTPQLGSRPLWAVRNERWKYISTDLDDGTTASELYDLKSDAVERHNVAGDPRNRSTVAQLSTELVNHRKAISQNTVAANDAPDRSSTDSETPRTDLFISGIYPHLTTYGVYSQNGGHDKPGHNECGIGAIVPWAGKLWMVNYAPHQPKGSEHKLFSVDPDLRQPMTVHPESVGGTPAGRMIHAESQQLLIAHYLISAEGKVRVISPKKMPIRVTAIARHLTDPANLVYYIDMEGSIWEANVHTLDVKRLFRKPVPGWHGKGGYTSQGRLVVSNNGELHVGNYEHVLVGGKAKTKEERGVLAEFDGKEWRIVERRQFTEVTGPRGIAGGGGKDDPVWCVGWDRRSLRLKLLDKGKWHTYLLPKAAYCNDASHGWYTEWPRIREITPAVASDGSTSDRWMMDMHGMFFDFPSTFSADQSAGIKPIGSHLRYVPDFCDWNGRLVLASDETSIQGNDLAGQPQSNLWFGKYEDLKEWGPASGFGGPWIEDEVLANTPSDPFLIAGFDRRMIHLATGRVKPVESKVLRASDEQIIRSMPPSLSSLPRVSIDRGDWHEAARGFRFEVDKPVTVFLAVDRRGNPKLSPDWKRTDLSITWGKQFKDDVYSREFSAGSITVPANPTEHTPGAFGMPHLAFVHSDDNVVITPEPRATLTLPARQATTRRQAPVTFTLEVDRVGDGTWTKLASIQTPANGYLGHILPNDLDAVWLRVTTDRDCIATAFLHQTTARFVNGDDPNNVRLFDGLANVGEEAWGGLVYAAKRDRNLRVITQDDRHFDFSKSEFTFHSDRADKKLQEHLKVETEFRVDDASVVLIHEGRKLRLPKGNPAFDGSFAAGQPRASREVQSERHLANIHGTFYEVPLVTNGAPPAWNRMRPVSSHAKQIIDFCSWNGLLVLTGVRPNAKADGHLFSDPDQQVGLWFGGIDDLWKLGKPVGQGGPWLRSKVKAGVPSDPYLMTGYDRKTVEMSHQSESPVTFTIQIDIDGDNTWVDAHSFLIAPGKVERFAFPIGYSAAWMRVVSDQDTRGTVMLTYR